MIKKQNIAKAKLLNSLNASFMATNGFESISKIVEFDLEFKLSSNVLLFSFVRNISFEIFILCLSKISILSIEIDKFGLKGVNFGTAIPKADSRNENTLFDFLTLEDLYILHSDSYEISVLSVRLKISSLSRHCNRNKIGFTIKQYVDVFDVSIK